MLTDHYAHVPARPRGARPDVLGNGLRLGFGGGCVVRAPELPTLAEVMRLPHPFPEDLPARPVTDHALDGSAESGAGS
ncbi:hypothetical protein [Bailinhaonella thermotolerans]|uniref:Uncharacterized protein n=1 Tax=Bailinhaonella thermotolerans TaxID=1070861 RepID=A0A3A3ZZE4_9ACTN|nr:hypothetical protein [Bailinhaonella thermotolerans]RJL21069.1 hypothetical protein D5H75_38290 [Bailinhaonella thermotolerans]